MPEDSSDTPSMLPPDDRLRQRLGDRAQISSIICQERVEKAKLAVESRAKEFDASAGKEIEDLEALFRETVHGRDVSAAFAAFTDSVLNLKGRAGICGYQLATEVARSLHGFCLKAARLKDKERRIVQVHLDALRAIFRDRIRGDGGTIGETLLRDLNAVVRGYGPYTN